MNSMLIKEQKKGKGKKQNSKKLIKNQTKVPFLRNFKYQKEISILGISRIIVRIYASGHDLQRFFISLFIIFYFRQNLTNITIDELLACYQKQTLKIEEKQSTTRTSIHDSIPLHTQIISKPTIYWSRALGPVQ